MEGILIGEGGSEFRNILFQLMSNIVESEVIEYD
jgi:hypothetical protein